MKKNKLSNVLTSFANEIGKIRNDDIEEVIIQYKIFKNEMDLNSKFHVIMKKEYESRFNKQNINIEKI